MSKVSYKLLDKNKEELKSRLFKMEKVELIQQFFAMVQTVQYHDLTPKTICEALVYCDVITQVAETHEMKAAAKNFQTQLEALL